MPFFSTFYLSIPFLEFMMDLCRSKVEYRMECVRTAYAFYIFAEIEYEKNFFNIRFIKCFARYSNYYDVVWLSYFPNYEHS